MIRLPDIYELVWPLRPGVDGEARETAEQLLAERRQADAENSRRHRRASFRLDAGMNMDAQV